jgi:hypothetical protein
MALTSPGVEVTIIDESQYLPAAPSSVPLIVLATAQNKINASGTGVAVGTTAANANKLYAVTSQRDLVTLFGNPFFYKTTNGTPIQGYELNEYGLLAAYSALGSTNLAYVIRANIDLAGLIGQTGRPSGQPAAGSFWENTTTSQWGIFEFNAQTGAFTAISPIVITDAGQATVDGEPMASLGNIGSYAVYSLGIYGAPDSYSTYWYKNYLNTWVPLGTPEWRLSLPAVQGTAAATALPTPGPSVFLEVNGVQVVSTGTSPAQFVIDFANAKVPSATAAIDASGRFVIYSPLGLPISIGGTIGGSDAGLISALKIPFPTGTQASGYSFNSPEVAYGTNAQQPLWRSTEASPHPSGSVWIKTNSANLGVSLVTSQYNATTATWVSRNCPLGANDWSYNNSVDSTGGGSILADSLYAQYNFGGTASSPIQIFKRSSSGASVFVGTNTAPTFISGAIFTVKVSQPGSSALSNSYNVTLGGTTSAKFVEAWQSANIPYTTAAVSSTGAIVLTHTAGGVIVLDDTPSINASVASPIVAAGFIINNPPTTAGAVGAKWGPYKTITYPAAVVAVTGGSGVGLDITVSTTGYSPTFTATVPGTGYIGGDVINVTTPSGAGNYTLGIASVDGAGGATSFQLISGSVVTVDYTVQLSNWQVFEYTPNEIAPVSLPTNNTNWFYSVVNQVDIMTNVNGVWKGYRNVSYSSNGLPQVTGTPSTDPNGPIISATAPTVQSDGTALVYGDLWIDSNDLENYPVINRWQSVSGVDQWVLVDNTDQLTENGILFSDARWAPNGNVNPVTDAIPSIVSLLTSDYLDLDAPSAQSYPQGTLLFNTRRSGYNVKQFRSNYFNNITFPGATLPASTSTWVTVSGNMTNGAPYMGRKAQRAMIVSALRTTVDTSSQIREDQTFMNLLTCPNYCELQPNLVALNNDRGQTAYIIGDTPLRLAADANSIIGWATNTANATSTGEQGLVTRNTYLGLYYPSGITTDLQGSEVVVPSSHMMLRTMIYNDTVAYPWFAPAGQRRGIVDNATNIGYIDAASGEFVVNKNGQALRDVEYNNYLNPIAYFTNLGLLNYGNKNSFASDSALDRTNVSRLVCYLRYQLQRAVQPFLFEPNDSITRNQARAVVQTLLADIQAKRGIYDYVVVCDESNNTPARIDRNELWIDVAIEPVKAIEFIYIPVRILNTGEIAGLGQNG